MHSFFTMWASMSPRQVQITTFSSQWSPWTSTSLDRFNHYRTIFHIMFAKKEWCHLNAGRLPHLSKLTMLKTSVLQNCVEITEVFRLVTTSISPFSHPVSSSASPGSHYSYPLIPSLAGAFLRNLDIHICLTFLIDRDIFFILKYRFLNFF